MEHAEACSLRANRSRAGSRRAYHTSLAWLYPRLEWWQRARAAVLGASVRKGIGVSLPILWRRFETSGSRWCLARKDAARSRWPLLSTRQRGLAAASGWNSEQRHGGKSNETGIFHAGLSQLDIRAVRRGGAAPRLCGAGTAADGWRDHQQRADWRAAAENASRRGAGRSVYHWPGYVGAHRTDRGSDPFRADSRGAGAAGTGA